MAMATQKATGDVRHLDHFVLPAMDPGRAEKFYAEILGGRTLQKQSDESLTRIFMKVGQNHIGLFSQSRATIPKRETVESYPRCAFTLPANDFDRGMDKIKAQSPLAVPIEGGKNGCGLGRGVAFMDSEGNLVEIFRGGEEKITRVHHLHFDTLSLEESIKFYTGVLSLNLNKRQDGIAVLGVPSGQTIVLHQVKELSEVTRTTYRGRHFAFAVTEESFHAIVDKLHRAGIEERDEHGEREGRRPGQLGTYFKDPSGFRLQITNEDSATFAQHARG
jgi:catechol-2,3-dioxygenase